MRKTFHILFSVSLVLAACGNPIKVTVLDGANSLTISQVTVTTLGVVTIEGVGTDTTAGVQGDLRTALRAGGFGISLRNLASGLSAEAENVTYDAVTRTLTGTIPLSLAGLDLSVSLITAANVARSLKTATGGAVTVRREASASDSETSGSSSSGSGTSGSSSSSSGSSGTSGGSSTPTPTPTPTPSPSASATPTVVPSGITTPIVTPTPSSGPTASVTFDAP